VEQKMTHLLDLNPKWCGLLRPTSGEGLTLDCPKCGPVHRLAVYFSNPVDGKDAAPWQNPQWKRTGDKFALLTVEPSLEYPCFHGWIEEGEVIDISESPARVIATINGAQRIVALSPKQFRELKG
jgi:hypothetical protein